MRVRSKNREMYCAGIPTKIAAAGALLVAVAAVTFAAVAAHRPQSAQAGGAQTPSASHSLKSETRLITVDVSVRDKHGNPVRGLKPSDFRIFDNGNGPQQIAGFEFIEPPKIATAREPTAAPGKPSATPVKSAPAVDPVYSNLRYATLPVPPTAILLDPGTIAFQDHVTATLQALKLLDKLPAQTPIAVFLLNGSLTIVQSFTTDRNALRAAVSRSMIPAQKIQNPQTDANGKTPSYSASSAGSPGGGQAVTALQDFEKLEYEEQNTVIADQTSDAMRAIARILSGYPGRKNLIWISEAFPQWILPQAGFGARSVEAGDSSSLADPFRQVFNSSANYGDKLASDAQALVDARVAVYPVDARGLVAPSLYDASGNMLATDPVFMMNPGRIGPAMGAELSRENSDLFFSQATMEQIADDTGGTACRNTNDLSGCATRAIEDDSPDYEISYYPAGMVWDGSFHRITLKTDLHGVKIHYRRGYSAVDTTVLAKKHPMEFFRDACASLLPSTSIGLRAEPVRASKPGQTRYLLSVSPRALSVTPAGGKLDLHLMLAVCEFAPRGGEFRVHARNLPEKFPERDAEKWQTHDVQKVIDYDPKADTQRLRLAVLDTSTGLTGSVDVPAHPKVVFDIPSLDGQQGAAPASGVSEVYSHLQFRAPDGATGGLDLSGDKIEYRGPLGVELSAPAFFQQVYGSSFQCRAAKLTPETGSAEPNFKFAFKNSAGAIAVVDLSGAAPGYSGALPVDSSARAFFDRLWKLCHCQRP